jgi:uncharacterized protein YjbI with pentapeptide repeats
LGNNMQLRHPLENLASRLKLFCGELKIALVGDITSQQIEKMHANGQFKDFRGKYIINQSFNGMNLSGVNFSRSKIRGCSFENSTLVGAKFEYVDFGFSYRHTIGRLSLKSEEYSGKVIISWIETFFDSLYLSIWALTLLILIFLLIISGIWTAILIIIGFLALDVPNIIRKNLEYEKNNYGVSFKGANLRAASFLEAKIKNSNFDHSALDSANFRNAYIKSSSFNNSSLSYAEWKDSVICKYCSFSIDTSLIKLCQTRDGRKGDFEGKDLSKLRLDYVNLEQAKLNEVNLSGSFLRFAKFQNAQLAKANLIQTDLTQANLNSAYLYDANISLSKLRRSTLSHVFLGSVKALNTDFSESDFSGACIANWQINSGTNFSKIKCKYIYVDYLFRIGRQNLPENRIPKYGEFEEYEFQNLLIRYINSAGGMFVGESGLGRDTDGMSYLDVIEEGTPYESDLTNLIQVSSAKNKSRKDLSIFIARSKSLQKNF